MKRKYREAMRGKDKERDMWIDAADTLKQYEEAARRQTRWPPKPVEPAGGEPWRPVMTEQERREHEQYVKEQNLPF